MLKIVVEAIWPVKIKNYQKMIFEYRVDDVLE